MQYKCKFIFTFLKQLCYISTLEMPRNDKSVLKIEFRVVIIVIIVNTVFEMKPADFEWTNDCSVC